MLIESLEGRRLLCGTATSSSHLVSAATATPAIVVEPDFTPVLGTFGGDLLAGSTLDGYTATGQFKLVFSSYNANTGAVVGRVYVTDLVVRGKDLGDYEVPFSGDAHFTDAGGFDIHVTGRGFNLKLKGDYKRDDTYISGTAVGTDTSGGTTYNINYSYDLKIKPT
jgi:hypothetical protein